MDCTKVQANLAFSNNFGGHIIGSNLPANECHIDDGNDIEAVIERIKKRNGIATQVRAVLVKVSIAS
jgi:hypothetical protein